MMRLSELKSSFWQAAGSSASIGIMSHIEPDGDGFAASIALQELLRARGYRSEIVVDEGNLSRFAFLMENAELVQFSTELHYEMLVILDCNSYDRLGDRAALVSQASRLFLFDHHIPEGKLIETPGSFIDKKFATVGLILFETFRDDILALDEAHKIAIGNCLYTTILNDTNNFVNANTNPDVFRYASEIAELGIKAHELYKAFFLNQSASEMRYVGQSLATIELHLDDRILVLYSDLKMQEENRISPDSIMSITRYVQGVKDIEGIVYLREDAPGEYKVSMRSVHLDVNKVARKYGGGGHRSASGCSLKGEMKGIRRLILADLAEQLPAN